MKETTINDLKVQREHHLTMVSAIDLILTAHEAERVPQPTTTEKKPKVNKGRSNRSPEEWEEVINEVDSLRRSGMGIKEACKLCGISSQSYYSKKKQSAPAITKGEAAKANRDERLPRYYNADKTGNPIQ